MRENDRYILNSNNKTKAVWQVISKEIGKSTVNNKKIEINWGSNTSWIFKLLQWYVKSYFDGKVEQLAKQNSKVYAAYKMTKLKLNTCSETIFIKPVSEDEVEGVI